jgi:hypothetical protein
VIQISAKNDRKIMLSPVLVLENLHRAGRFRSTNCDLIFAGSELVKQALRDAKSPIPAPASELLPVVVRNRIVISVIVMEVAPEFFQTYNSLEAL